MHSFHHFCVPTSSPKGQSYSVNSYADELTSHCACHLCVWYIATSIPFTYTYLEHFYGHVRFLRTYSLRPQHGGWNVCLGWFSATEPLSIDVHTCLDIQGFSHKQVISMAHLRKWLQRPLCDYFCSSLWLSFDHIPAASSHCQGNWRGWSEQEC